RRRGRSAGVPAGSRADCLLNAVQPAARMPAAVSKNGNRRLISSVPPRRAAGGRSAAAAGRSRSARGDDLRLVWGGRVLLRAAVHVIVAARCCVPRHETAHAPDVGYELPALVL